MKPVIVATSLWMGGIAAMHATDPLSKSIDPAKWKSVPCVAGRPATQQDVKEGRAVFVISGPVVRALDIRLPHCAIWHDAERHKDVPVICIQAEDSGKFKLVGIRLVHGGNAVCTLPELTLLDRPDERFTR